MRGGKRAGAGRPIGTDKKIRSIRLNDAEYDKVREYIKNLREEEKMLEGIRSYVENGKYYFADEQEVIETTELINTNEVSYDEYEGYQYHGKNVLDYQPKLSFDEFYNAIIFEGGVSRYDPEIGVSFALMKDKDGEEIFYAECDNGSILEKAGLDGSSEEDYEKGQEVIEKHDDLFLENAYKAYLSGETVYRE